MNWTFAMIGGNRAIFLQVDLESTKVPARKAQRELLKLFTIETNDVSAK